MSKIKITWLIIFMAVLIVALLTFFVLESIQVIGISKDYNTSDIRECDKGQGFTMIGCLLWALIAYGVIAVLIITAIITRQKDFAIQFMLITVLWMRVYRLVLEYEHKLYQFNEYYHQWNYHLIILLFITLWTVYLYFIQDDKKNKLRAFAWAGASATLFGCILYISYDLMIHQLMWYFALGMVLLVASTLVMRLIHHRLWQKSTLVDLATYVVGGGGFLYILLCG